MPKEKLYSEFNKYDVFTDDKGDLTKVMLSHEVYDFFHKLNLDPEKLLPYITQKSYQKKGVFSSEQVMRLSREVKAIKSQFLEGK